MFITVRRAGEIGTGPGRSGMGVSSSRWESTGDQRQVSFFFLFLSLTGGEACLEFSAGRNRFLGSAVEGPLSSRREHPLWISF